MSRANTLTSLFTTRLSLEESSFLMSAGLHGLLLLVMLYGLPHARKPLPESVPIQVISAAELSKRSTAPEISPEAASSKKPDPQQKAEKPREQPPEKPREQPKPPPVEQKTPPPPVKPEPPKPEDAKPEPPKPLPKPDTKPLQPTATKPEPPKPQPQAKVPPKPETTESIDTFANSILKNVEKTRPQPAANAAASSDKPRTGAATSSGALAEDVSTKLSGSELDALRQQISRCWNFPAGAKAAEELVITLRVTMNPDRTVRSAVVADPPANPSLYWQAASESAQRALYNPRCTPLRLPEGKFNEWRSFTIRFDPRQMLGL